jgi:putative transcriptional regulator
MPIVVYLDVMLAIRKMTVTELSKGVGRTVANISILKSGKAHGLRFNTLEKICDVLECQPGDLLKNVSDEEYRKLFRIQ